MPEISVTGHVCTFYLCVRSMCQSPHEQECKLYVHASMLCRLQIILFQTLLHLQIKGLKTLICKDINLTS
jgi:hypothetical protein